MYIVVLITVAKRLETTQISINTVMDKQIVVYTYNEIFSAHKKEWRKRRMKKNDTYYSMDEPQNITPSEKSQTQEVCFVMYDSIYTKHLE